MLHCHYTTLSQCPVRVAQLLSDEKRHKMIKDSSTLTSEPFNTNDACQFHIGKCK